MEARHLAITPDRGPKPILSEEDLRNELRVFTRYFLLEAGDGTSLLVTGEGFGPYTLEWFPATRTGRHRRADREYTKAEIEAAILDAYRGGSLGLVASSWPEVADPAPSGLDRLLQWIIGPGRRPACGGPSRTSP